MNGLCVGFCMVLLLLFSETAMLSAQQAAAIFTNGVLPALFPVMVLCGLLLPQNPMKHSHKRRRVVSLLLFSFAAGSPASAKRVKQLSDVGFVQKEHIVPLLAMTGVMSPMFFVGTLSGWMGVHGATWVMLGLHWLGALLTGACYLLYHHLKHHRAVQSTYGLGESKGEPPTLQKASLLVALPTAVTAAAQAMLAVCGAMLTFAIVVGVLRAALTAAAPTWVASHMPFLAVVHAMLEIGGGAAEVLASYRIPSLPLLCGLCSFGGLSIWLQNLLFVGECIHPAKLLALRALHGVLAYGLCALFFGCFPLAWQALTPVVASVTAVATSAHVFSPLLPALLLMLMAFGAHFPRPRAS